MTSIFDGTGLWIFNMSALIGKTPQATAIQNMITTMQLTGAAWAAPKTANGVLPFNRSGNVNSGPDTILPDFYAAMTVRNLPRIGWGYIYGNYPVKEAEVTLAQINKYKLQAYLIDPEIEYEKPGKATAAAQFMTILKNGTDIPIALASWRFPSQHQPFPWLEFLAKMNPASDVHMPQVYWEGDNTLSGPANQVAESIKELQALKALPVYPIGAAYMNRQKDLKMWIPTAGQMDSFATMAKNKGCKGISWWCWDQLIAKDAASPAQPGKYDWWKTITKEASLFEAAWPTAPEPASPPAAWSQAIDAWARSRGYTGAGISTIYWEAFINSWAEEQSADWQGMWKAAFDTWARTMGYTGPKPA
jgi:hypothetical protein